MKHVFFFLLSAALISCAGSSTEPKVDASKGMPDSMMQNAMKDTSDYTSLQWIDSTSQNLGKIAKGGVVEVSWRFKNTGSKPLVIAEARASCGCTVADRPEAPIAPGKEGVIKAKYDTKGQHVGENQKTVTVVANTTGSTTNLLEFRVVLTEN